METEDPPHAKAKAHPSSFPSQCRPCLPSDTCAHFLRSKQFDADESLFNCFLSTVLKNTIIPSLNVPRKIADTTHPSPFPPGIHPTLAQGGEGVRHIHPNPSGNFSSNGIQIALKAHFMIIKQTNISAYRQATLDSCSGWMDGWEGL